jgi:hypothetical protein
VPEVVEWVDGAEASLLLRVLNQHAHVDAWPKVAPRWRVLAVVVLDGFARRAAEAVVDLRRRPALVRNELVPREVRDGAVVRLAREDADAPHDGAERDSQLGARSESVYR